MSMSHSAVDSGWIEYPAAEWDERNAPVPLDKMMFWKHCIDRHGGPVLELACGNGRYLVPLAGYVPGHEVVGVDINEGFVESARALAEERRKAGSDIRPEFIVGDVVRLDLGRRFPLAIMTSWTWSVLLTQEDQLEFLRRLHEHLEPGGAFAFNVFMPEQRQRGLRKVEGRFEWPASPDYHGRATRTYDAATQVETMVGGAHPIRERIRHTNLSEFRLLFDKSGFEIVEMYADDEDMRPFTGAPTDDYTILAERR